MVDWDTASCGEAANDDLLCGLCTLLESASFSAASVVDVLEYDGL